MAADTGAAVASAASVSARSAHEEFRLNEGSQDRFVDLSREIQALRELARAAPGAAVVTAYGHVTAALKTTLTENGAQEPEHQDAPALARAAANRGLVTDKFVETVQGLAILKDLGLREGAGTGLSVKQANEYVDLVVAALYVLRSLPPDVDLARSPSPPNPSPPTPEL